MTDEHTTLIFILLVCLYGFLRVARWVLKARPVEIDPLSEPNGDVVNAPRRSV